MISILRRLALFPSRRGGGHPPRPASLPFCLLLSAFCFSAACSLRTVAVNQLGNALASGGDVYASDDDPQLVGEALPFTLKLIESLLAESPRHEGLLLAATKGFTQYAYGWVEPNAGDTPAGGVQAERARRLYARARNYGLRALEVAHPGFEQLLRSDQEAALRLLRKEDLPVVYWTAASWGLLVSRSKTDLEVVADLPLAGALIDRALELDETWGDGAIHAFLITYEPNRPGGEGDPLQRARSHFERAVALSDGALASPYVSLAENVSVQTQDRAEFDALLQKALAIDADAVPRLRVENLLAQQRARWLLEHVDEFFLESPDQEVSQ